MWHCLSDVFIHFALYSALKYLCCSTSHISTVLMSLCLCLFINFFLIFSWVSHCLIRVTGSRGHLLCSCGPAKWGRGGVGPAATYSRCCRHGESGKLPPSFLPLPCYRTPFYSVWQLSHLPHIICSPIAPVTKGTFLRDCHSLLSVLFTCVLQYLVWDRIHLILHVRVP